MRRAKRRKNRVISLFSKQKEKHSRNVLKPNLGSTIPRMNAIFGYSRNALKQKLGKTIPRMIVIFDYSQNVLKPNLDGQNQKRMELTCVATMTGFPALLHFPIIIFCARKTFSGGISMPRSPRATMTPSVASRISSNLAANITFEFWTRLSKFIECLLGSFTEVGISPQV